MSVTEHGGGAVVNEDPESVRDPLTRVRLAMVNVFGAARDFLAVGGTITANPSEEPLAETVRQLIQVTSNSMQAVLILVEHGCGTDALKLARTMFETAVDIHYLDSHPEMIQDYLDFEWIKRKKHYEYLQEFAPDQAKAVDKATLDELTAEYTRVKPQFTGPKNKVRSQWHKSDRRQIARTVGGETIYGGLYPFVSSLTHMDVLGLKIARQPNGQVEAVPSVANLELGLQIATLSYAMALDAGNTILKTGADQRIQSAFEKLKQSAPVAQTLKVRDELEKPKG